jgi:uncharacterized RDD family membrane protein YckC
VSTPDDPYFVQPPSQPPPGPPQFGAPGYGQPQYGAPQFGGPAWGSPGYGQPPFGGPYAGGAPYASWLQRVGAALLDWLITFVPGFVVVLIGIAIGNGLGVFIAIVGYLAVLAFGIWNVVFRQGRTGQTLGKQQVGIKLIREQDGQVVGAGMSFIRQVAHVVDGFACDIGYLWPLWDAKRQTFADKICTTIVITV